MGDITMNAMCLLSLENMFVSTISLYVDFEPGIVLLDFTDIEVQHSLDVETEK